MLFSNGLLDRSMRTERMLYVNEGGGATSVRSQLTRRAVVEDRPFLRSSLRRLDSKKHRPPFD